MPAPNERLHHLYPPPPYARPSERLHHPSIHHHAPSIITMPAPNERRHTSPPPLTPALAAPWVVSAANAQYSLSKLLPQTLVLPQGLSDKAHTHFFSHRLVTLTP